MAAAAWIAGAVGVLHPSVAGAMAAVLWTLAVVALALTVAARSGVRQGRSTSAMSVCALLAVALAAAAAVATQIAMVEPVRTHLAASEIGGGRAITVEATVVGKVEPGSAGWRWEALLTRFHRGDEHESAQTYPRGVPVLVRAAERSEGLDPGASIRVSGTAWEARPGERSVLVVDAAENVTVLTPPTGLFAAASSLRHGLHALAADLPDPGGGLIAGLSVGDTSAVSAELDAAMKVSSLSHLTAVSGANCALVVVGGFGLATLCRARRAVRVGSGMALLVGFVVLVSPEPSVVRAAAMASIAMLGVLLGRPGAGLSLLTAAVSVLLVIDPWLALSLGFALSTAATGALLVLAGPLADGLSRWMPGPLALAISIPLAAQLACAPIIVLIAPQLSTYGVIANILAAPAAPAGTVLGLLACLSAGIPLLGSGLAALAWLPATWVAGTATTLAQVPGSQVPWPEGVAGLLALTAVGFGVAVLIIPVRRSLRLVGLSVVTATVGLGVAVGPVTAGMERGRIPPEWVIAACDVGQGDAILIRSGGAVALIDTGPDPALLEHCLSVLGVATIDVLVLTHFDLDHRGGVDAVQGRVGLLLHGPPDGADDERLVREIAQRGARTAQVVRGMSGPLGQARWRVLWPRAHAAGGNDASVVVDIHGGRVPASLYLGDLSASAQEQMRAGAALLTHYDVVKVAHHGSADQDPVLYERVDASLALVTVGENTYGHPRSEILGLLSDAGTRVVRTDLHGLITLSPEMGGIRLWHARAPTSVGADR